MQGQPIQTKFQKWMKNASQQRMNKITESKKYNKDIQKEALINVEEFMIELDFLDQKQEKQGQIQKGLIKKLNKRVQNNDKEKEKDNNIVLGFDTKQDRQKESNLQILEKKQCEDEISQEEQKSEKQNNIDQMMEKRKKECQDLSKIQKTIKLMIIQDDLEEKKTENTNSTNNGNNCIKQLSKEQIQDNKSIQQIEIKQRNYTEEQFDQLYQNQIKKIKQKSQPKIIIQSNDNTKRNNPLPVTIVDAYMQTDDTSDIHGQEIFNLILLEQNMVYQLNQLHDKILRMLNNQI